VVFLLAQQLRPWLQVKRIVSRLRKQRAGMVQTPDQYLFCYQALKVGAQIARLLDCLNWISKLTIVFVIGTPMESGQTARLKLGQTHIVSHEVRCAFQPGASSCFSEERLTDLCPVNLQSSGGAGGGAGGARGRRRHRRPPATCSRQRWRRRCSSLRRQAPSGGSRRIASGPTSPARRRRAGAGAGCCQPAGFRAAAAAAACAAGLRRRPVGLQRRALRGRGGRREQPWQPGRPLAISHFRCASSGSERHCFTCRPLQVLRGC